MNKMKQNSAITLIALVITIIVLLILAAVTLNIVLGENGIFSKAREASEKTKYSTAKETLDLKLLDIQADCGKEGKEYNVENIVQKIELSTEEQIILEKYYYGSIAKKINNSLQKNPGPGEEVKGIVVSVEKYTQYKFLIGKEGKIEGVAISNDVNSLTQSDFETIAEFEKKLGTVTTHNQGEIVDNKSEIEKMIDNGASINEIINNSEDFEEVLEDDANIAYIINNSDIMNSIASSSSAMAVLGSSAKASFAAISNSNSYNIITSSENISYFDNNVISVPEMTSNTTPEGVVSSSTYYSSGYEPWHAFDKHNGQGYKWAGVGYSYDTNKYIQYEFPSANYIYKLEITNHTYNTTECPTAFEFWGSNDGTNWTTIISNTTLEDTSSGITHKILIPYTGNAYKYYRICGLSCTSGNTCIGELQFYCVQN